MAARITYDGLVLTSIDVQPVKGTERTVTFSGSIAGRADDDTATFLENVRQINDTDENGKRLFEAETVTVARAKEIINGDGDDLEGGEGGKPLFCVHGFNTQPGQHLNKMNSQATREKFNQGKFTLVPVLWPSAGGVTNYGPDRITAPGAGNAFKTLKKGIDSFPSKSLLCHSMGNYILRHAADEKFQFDNIFMAAADVRHDLFHKDYIRGGSEPERKDGLRICQMLSNPNKGKVHILWNGADKKLVGSSWNPTNWVTKMGLVGNNMERTWWGGMRKGDLTDEEIQGCVVNFECGPNLSWWDRPSHGYYFNDFAVKYYQDHHF